MKFRNGSPISARQPFRRLFPACALAFVFLNSHAQDPLKRYPQNYQLIFENAQVSVIHVHYGPHENLAVHDHSDNPTLFVYLSDSGPVRYHIQGVPPATINRPAVSLGSFRYSPGGIERHSVQSLSDRSSDFLRIELKQFPLQGGEAFRHGAPVSLNAAMNEKEFGNDQVEVDRLVCLPGRECTSAATSESSLIVAFDDLRLKESTEAKDETLNSGAIRWIKPNAPIIVSASTSAPAHLLRILIKSPRKHAPVS